MTLLTQASIPSQRAEIALTRINEVLASFRVAWPVASAGQAQQGLARDTFFQLVTIAELFAGEHLLDVTEKRLPNDELVFRIWDERAPRIVRDWEARKQGWKSLHGVSWYPRWKELKGLTTARNIIAHGMGTLTRMQFSRGQIREGVVNELADAKLALRGFELWLTDADVERCGRVVRHFVGWLDAQPVP